MGALVWLHQQETTVLESEQETEIRADIWGEDRTRKIVLRFEFNCPLSKRHQSVQARPNCRPPGEQYETPSKQIKERQGDIPSLNCKQDERVRRNGGRSRFSICNNWSSPCSCNKTSRFALLC